MIEPAAFVRSAAKAGWELYTGVPCSHLGSLLARVETHAPAGCVTAANEGDAVAIATASALGGREAIVFMQNSGLGNAVNPLSSLCWPLRQPVLLLITLRGDPMREPADEPQHRLMGRITRPLLDALEIPSETLSPEPGVLDATLSRARDSMRTSGHSYALIVRDGTFAAGAPAGGRERLRVPAAGHLERHSRGALEARPARGEALERIVAATPLQGSVVIASTGYTSRELLALADRPNHLYMVGSMGCASALGLGLALARPDLRVVVIDGDGAALMRLGNLAVVGAHAGPNLLHVILDNEVHESTGLQPTVSPVASFAGIANACGYARAVESDRLDALDELLGASGRDAGPQLLHLKIRPGAPRALPRPHLSPDRLRARLAAHLAGAGAPVAAAREVAGR